MFTTAEVLGTARRLGLRFLYARKGPTDDTPIRHGSGVVAYPSGRTVVRLAWDPVTETWRRTEDTKPAIGFCSVVMADRLEAV